MASTPPSVPAPGHRRAHPARRARRIAGTATVAGMLVLTGGIAAATHPTSTASATPSATDSTTAVTTDSRSYTSSAQSGSTSSQPDTSSHGS